MFAAVSMKLRLSLTIFPLWVAGALCLPLSASAVQTYNDAGNFFEQAVEPTGVQKVDLSTASGEIIKTALSALGLLFFVLVIYAGIRWMTARGDEEAVTKARETIFAAVIGLAIVLASYAITSFLQTRVLSGSPESGTNPSGGTIGGEALGCCIDWGEGGAFESYGVPAYRITTIDDCQAGGEAKEPSGYSCTGPEIGCWTFQTGLLDVNQCREANEQ